MKKQNQYPVATEDLWQIIENLHDEIMVYDNDYHLVFVNKAAERHYGKTAEELIGTHFSQLDETYWSNSTLPEVYEKKEDGRNKANHESRSGHHHHLCSYIR